MSASVHGRLWPLASVGGKVSQGTVAALEASVDQRHGWVQVVRLARLRRRVAGATR